MAILFGGGWISSFLSLEEAQKTGGGGGVDLVWGFSFPGNNSQTRKTGGGGGEAWISLCFFFP